MQACGVGDEEVIRGQDRAGPESAARARFRSDAWRSSARQERDSGEIPRSRAMEAVTVKVARKWWLWWLKQRWWPVLCATGAVGGDAGRRLAHYLRVGTGAKADIKAGDGAEVNAEGAPSIGATTVAREGGAGDDCTAQLGGGGNRRSTSVCIGRSRGWLGQPFPRSSGGTEGWPEADTLCGSSKQRGMWVHCAARRAGGQAAMKADARGWR